MYEIDFEVFVDAGDREGLDFMNYVDALLYEKYQGDISPAIRAGERYVSCTVETEKRSIAEAITPVLVDLESIGLRIKTIQVCEILELA